MLMRADRVACQQVADALLGIVDGADAGAPSTAALDHLEWCRTCAAELQDLALALIALRRLGGAAVEPEPAERSWSRLRARIERSRVAARRLAWRWRTTMLGLAASSLVVAGLVGPTALHMPLAGGLLEPTGLTRAQVERASRAAEATYILQSNTGTLAVAQLTEAGPVPGSRRYPDGHKPERKEVSPDTSGLVRAAR